MSEAKLISPMLDGFAIGGPMSDHHGICCYPAMPDGSDKRYIVKIISIPASQVQLDALLLAGAYASKDSALAYFKELADGICAEADVLKKLSRFEGFIPFEDLQLEPKDDGTGYDVYLLSPYKRSLERHMRKKPMTHLNAVNLGLDLCASMVVCRRMGYLYVDLKPSNIFINEKNEFRIGDLGFQKLDSLKYASLPDKYRSAYTAPEICDAWSSLNDTLDTYAIGMILYQVYNDGKLPFEGQAGSEELPPPLYADYEMAEIILKAIDPNPELRWTDPMLMGQALVAYMQRNTVNDVSIVPLPDTASDVPAAPEAPVEPQAEESAADEVPETAEAEPDDADDTAADDEVEILPGLILEEDVTIVEDAIPAAAQTDAAPAADELTDLSFMDEMVSDDTAPDADTAEAVEYAELSDETSDMLSLADELIALEMPEPVVAPEPIDIPMPEPIVLEDEPEEAPVNLAATAAIAAVSTEESEPESEEAAPEASEATDDPQEPEDSDEDDLEYDDDEPEKKPRRWGGIIAAVIILALLAAALFGGYYYYNNYYLQTVDSLLLEGDANNLIVLVESDVDETLLKVICTDTYGTTRTEPVKNGKATFENLNPDTIYQIKVVIDGFHELKGDITDDYTTPAQTVIVRFDAIAGSEEGSVVLNFTVDGKDSDTWTVTYTAEGEQAKSVTFTGHLVTVSGLALDKEYTFTLSGIESMYIVGTDTVQFTPSAPVYAKDLEITACNDSGLTASWTAPEGTVVESWIVHCYSNEGFDETATTTDLTYTFTNIDPAQGYIVEVIAQGMSVGSRAYVSANSATITSFQADNSIPLALTVTWDYTGTAPESGWLILYNLEGSDKQEVIQTTENSVTLTNVLPGGTYHFMIQASDGTTVFGGAYSCSAGEITIFSGYGVTANNMTVYMVRRPEVANWDRNNLNWDDYTTTHASGDKVSLLIQMDCKYNTSDELVTTLFVVRDMAGNLVCTSTSESSWTWMWYQRFCELDIPTMPTAPGNYTLDVYFNNMAVAQLEFVITE